MTFDMPCSNIRSLPTEIVQIVAVLLLPRCLENSEGKTLAAFLFHFTHVDMLDLVSFAKTCKKFWDICLPFVYSFAHLHCTKRAELLEARIQELGLQMSTVKHITIYVKESEEPKPDLLSDLYKFTGVTTLYLDGVHLCQVTIRALKHLHQLRMLGLDIWSPLEDNGIPGDDEFECVPPLSTLRLGLYLFDKYARTAVIPLLRAVQGSLKEISISGPYPGRGGDIIHQLDLHRMTFPNLKILKIYHIPFLPSSLFSFVKNHQDTIEYFDVTCNDNAPKPLTLSWLSLACKSIVDTDVLIAPIREILRGEELGVDDLDGWEHLTIKSVSVAFENVRSSPKLSHINSGRKKAGRALTDLRINFRAVNNKQPEMRLIQEMFSQPIFGRLKFLSLLVPYRSTISDILSALAMSYNKNDSILKTVVLTWNSSMMTMCSLTACIDKDWTAYDSAVKLKDASDLLWTQWELSNYRVVQGLVSAFLGACPSVERVEWQIEYERGRWTRSWIWTRDTTCKGVLSVDADAGDQANAQVYAPVMGRLNCMGIRLRKPN
ncbi:hypothetical protein DFH11DRAFT_1621009 [Phellopilus nigrolimitatus]|nr:hypothetical protein DFH11DRAFT_1621009 [Phellopilus nigrolimitatus]